MGFVVVDRVLMSIHDERPFWSSVPYLKAEITFLMTECKALKDARESCEYRCPLCDEPLHDPVKVLSYDDTITVDRKYALVKKLNIVEDDVEMRARVDAHVAEHKAPVDVPGVASTWKQMMPPCGFLRPYIAEDAF